MVLTLAYDLAGFDECREDLVSSVKDFASKIGYKG